VDVLIDARIWQRNMDSACKPTQSDRLMKELPKDSAALKPLLPV